MAESSSLAIAMNLFTSPSMAFASLKARPRSWLPLLVLLGGYAIVNFLYINSVDLGWFMEQQLAANPALTEQQRAEAVAQAANVSPAFYGSIGVVSTTVLVSLVLFLVSLYYTVVSFVSSDGVKLKQWWAFACWGTLPSVLGMAATIVNLSLSDARFMLQDAINPLSFGNLLGIERTTATPVVARILLGLDLFSVWSLALSAIGYQLYTGKSFVKSVLVVLGPLALVVLVGTTLAALR
jgi:hypothetical protein